MADVLKEDDEAEDDLVVVEEQPEPEEDEDEDDERVAQSDDDDSEDEREAIRERRRKEKLERKQRRDEAIKRDKLEMDFLRKRNDDLERRLTAQEQRAHQGDLNALDQQMAQAAKEGRGAVSLDGRLIDIASIRMAEALIAKADSIAAAV